MVEILKVVTLTIGSWLSGLDPAWIALIGTLFGGVGLKVIEWWLGRAQREKEEQAKYAREYKEEIKNLSERMRVEEQTADEWREKYYDLRDENMHLKTMMRLGGLEPPDVVD